MGTEKIDYVIYDTNAANRPDQGSVIGSTVLVSIPDHGIHKERCRVGPPDQLVAFSDLNHARVCRLAFDIDGDRLVISDLAQHSNICPAGYLAEEHTECIFCKQLFDDRRTCDDACHHLAHFQYPCSQCGVPNRDPFECEDEDEDSYWMEYPDICPSCGTMCALDAPDTDDLHNCEKCGAQGVCYRVLLLMKPGQLMYSNQ